MDMLRSQAMNVIDLALTTSRPYAVFVGRGLEVMPADGKRFARLQRDPERMAQCVGVFDGSADVGDVAAAIAQAGGQT